MHLSFLRNMSGNRLKSATIGAGFAEDTVKSLSDL
jgi:hypothetical protein